MDTIKIYIENLFNSLPKTNEVIRAKEELIVMMEDKYNELKGQGKSENEAIGIVISEFGNIDELKEELGINRNFNQYEEDTSKKDQAERKISLDEADDFIQNTTKFAFKISIGVVLCILSVVPLIILSAFSLKENTIDTVSGIEYFNAFNISEKAGIAVGLIFLFVSIAIAVAIFIISGLKYEKYSYLKKERFLLDSHATKFVSDLYDQYRSTFAIKITLGVMLCIMSAIPVVVAGILFDNSNDIVITLCVGLLLVIIAAAVFLFITAGMKRDCYMQLLQQEEYEPQNKDKDDLASKVGSVYWPIVTAGYLGWSFITMDWHITWIVWPIAGVLFGGIAAICNIIAPNKKDKY